MDPGFDLSSGAVAVGSVAAGLEAAVLEAGDLDDGEYPAAPPMILDKTGLQNKVSPKIRHQLKADADSGRWLRLFPPAETAWRQITSWQSSPSVQTVS